MPTPPCPKVEEHVSNDDRTRRKSVLTTEFRRVRAGVWDVYEQIPRGKFRIGVPWISKMARNIEVIEDLPFVWRASKDLIRIRACWYYLSLLILAKIMASIQPAVALWFTGHLLTIVQVAVDERRLDNELLIFVFTGRIFCAIAGGFLKHWEEKLQVPLARLANEYSDKVVFDVLADLDVPTQNDKVVKGKLDAVMGCTGQYGIIWGSVSVILDLSFSVIRLVAEFGVLVKIVGGQKDEIALTLVHLGQEVTKVLLMPGWIFLHTCAWVAMTDNEHYVKLAGLDRLVQGPEHKQEVVAGNSATFLKAAYKRAYAHVSGRRAGLVESLRHLRASGLEDITFTLVPKSVEEVAEAVYLLKSAAHPETIPSRLMIIKLVQTASRGFVSELWRISFQAKTISQSFHKVRQLYEIREIQNMVPDGVISFPEDCRSSVSGITVEFRHVSFRYPGKDDFALRDVSFKLEKGQLCVIVGTNGSGKSTVLKLMLRLYDPTEGTILVNDKDIKTLKLAGLRESMAVLFQDYTHLPLPIGDNIAIGDPRGVHDEAKIREAARLAGAEDFVETMTEGFDTYLQRPVQDVWSIPCNAKTKSGMKIDRNLVCDAIGRVGNEDSVKLSGGQMQRLAVSRMFMRGVLSEEARVGLLLFDEPSAALDPTAEHDLFTQIRKLRGEKTVIFSSHRFGQLTKPADLILYMNDSRIMECGTHEELMAKGGNYAELWNLQVKAFL